MQILSNIHSFNLRQQNLWLLVCQKEEQKIVLSGH